MEKKKISYNEIKKLHEKLWKMGIKHEFIKKHDGYQIIIEKFNSKVSFIEHCGSFGSWGDLIEAWDFIGEPAMLRCDSCIDYLAYRGFISKK